MGNSSTRVLTVDEDGILTRVMFHALGENKIGLHADNEGGKYRAHIYFDDGDFCLQVYERLKGYVGKPIKDVGNMEIKLLACLRNLESPRAAGR